MQNEEKKLDVEHQGADAPEGNEPAPGEAEEDAGANGEEESPEVDKVDEVPAVELSEEEKLGERVKKAFNVTHLDHLISNVPASAVHGFVVSELKRVEKGE